VILEDEPSSYEVLATSTAYTSGRVFSVRVDEVRLPSGDVVTRDLVDHPGAVGVIALNDAGEVLLVQQYRHAVQRLLWEPPAGLLDVDGEAPLIAAQRELLEEAHVAAETWDVLVDLFTTPGMSDEAVRIYLARDVRDGEGERWVGHGEERDMPTAWVPLDDVVAAVLAGRLHNPVLVAGALAAAAARGDGFRGLRPGDSPWAERPKPEVPTG
jgi:ADP-ribose pyrophosphatase